MLTSHVRPVTEDLGVPALFQMARDLLHDVSDEIISIKTVVAAEHAGVWRDDEGRIRHDQVELPGMGIDFRRQRLEQITFDELDVRDVVEARVEAGEVERAPQTSVAITC